MAKTITVTLKHNLGRAAARTRLEQGLRGLRSDVAGYVTEIQEKWAGDHVDLMFKTLVAQANASVDVEDDAVIVTTRLPLLLTVFAPQIEHYLKSIGQDFFVNG